MPSNDARTALVTGATSGIGYDLSKLFARDGYRLVINARHERDLAWVASTFEDDFGLSVTIIPQNLSQPGAADEIRSRWTPGAEARPAGRRVGPDEPADRLLGTVSAPILLTNIVRRAQAANT